MAARERSSFAPPFHRPRACQPGPPPAWAGDLADALAVGPDRISDAHLDINARFQTRKRGVETKLILAGQAAPRDEILLRNIALAQRYVDRIKAGQTFTDIAGSEGVSKRRIQHLVELAFLAPDIVRDIRDGRQPTGLTSDWLMRHAIPPIWTNQRALFKTL